MYNLRKSQDLAWRCQCVDLARGLKRKSDFDSRRRKVSAFTKQLMLAVGVF